MKHLIAYTPFLLIVTLTWEVSAQAGSTLSVLAIGNGHYKSFDSYPDINYSAHVFLDHFKESATPCIMESSNERMLSKEFMLSTIKSFVEFVEQQPGDQNIGIIYYCGHGVANKSGTMYFVPGDVEKLSENMRFEDLSERLLNVDEIFQIIINAQTDPNKSKYIIMGDCCSTRVPSKLYDGIFYEFTKDDEHSVTGTITYDSSFIQKHDTIITALELNAIAQFDSSGNVVFPGINSSKRKMDEIGHLPGELIRAMTMKNNGNLVLYSSAMGQSTEMVKSAEKNPGNLEVAPLCRRTQLFFKARKTDSISNTAVLLDYLKVLTDEKFDRHTAPSVVNRSR